MKRFLVIIITFGLLAGCASPKFQVKNDTDAVTNKQTIYSTNNIFKPKDGFDYEISFDIQINDKGTPKQDICMVLQYTWKGWAFITPGESLIFNVDGEIIKFKTEKGSANNRSVGSGSYISEYARYDFNKNKIEKIINGKNVIGKVVGTKFDLNFTVTPENQNNFKTMLASI